MAEAQVLIETLMHNLNALIKNWFGPASGFENDIDGLFVILLTIRNALADAEMKRRVDTKLFRDVAVVSMIEIPEDVISVSTETGKWINILQDANWLSLLKGAVYDAIDALDGWSMEADKELRHRGGGGSSVLSFLNSNTRKKKTIGRKWVKKMKEIISELDEIAGSKLRWSSTWSNTTGPQIFGRDEDEESVIHRLLSNGSREDISIFPIVGMGGVGKTTLARMVYNDPRVVRSFEARIWVFVSHPFDLKFTLRAIIESFSDKYCDLEEFESLQKEVCHILREKKYLIVLDDIWNESQDLLAKLMIFLEGGARGSSIIVTTRTASIEGTFPPHFLKHISLGDCWSLFRSHVYDDLGVEIPNSVKQLLKKGMHMDEEFSLRLSYHCLTQRVRHCFAYCCMFPKGYQMKKDELIGLWIANGFIPSHTRMEVEDIAEDTFNELVQRSFFQDCTMDFCGNIVACKMNDQMRDLASLLMKDECSTIEVNENAALINKIRHLSLICKSPPLPTRLAFLFTSHSSLHTLILFQNHDLHHPCMFDISSLRFLRALNLRGMSIETLQPSVCYLRHLRYLDLSKNCMTSLPESIQNLRNLQVNLSENEKINTLPLSICALPCLRRLDLSHCSLTSLPDAIQNLLNLRTLDLSGNVEITKLPLCIGELQNLKYFNLSQCSVTSLPESFLTLSNLQRLDLSRNYSIATLPDSIDNLLSLRYLNLFECNIIISLPESIGGLKNLETLILRRCSSLGALPESIGNMSSLRHLDVQGCHKLTKMPVGLGHLRRLQTLNVFVVGIPDRDSGCGGIKQLQTLNQINGELEIQVLQNVGNPNDARQANLRSKYYLTKLKMSWENVGSWEENNNNNVLEGLQLPPNIQHLIINAYACKTCFPQEFLKNLNGLRSLQICNCKELVGLSQGLCNLTSLEELQIECCNSMECLPRMGSQGSSACLVSLQIESCGNVASVSEGLMHLTSLKTLSLQNCPELELAPGDFHHLISLQYLRLGWLPKLRVMPVGTRHLTMLQHLELEYCWNLKMLPKGMQNLTFLERLKIHYCPELQLAEEDFQHLISLRTLEIEFLPKLRALPEGIKHLTMLQHLNILRCENLRMLPEGLKYLTALQSLNIRNCHQDLHRSYEKDKGEHWHLISHVSHLNIDKPPKDSSA